ncbi:MAG: hypothetical protein HRT71_21760 [Flavobacteriales bacterium]|nr:hypothetical protein [Flavobacteriales bacterium]
MVNEIERKQEIRAVLIFCSLIGYILISYFTPRDSIYQLFGLFGALFGLYVYFVRTVSLWSNVKILLAAALLFRISLLWLTPNLSDDYFRFIWDGRSLLQNINPFQFLPAELVFRGVEGLDESLLNELNSPRYYSVYPPIHQFVFGVASYIFPDDVKGAIVVMRLFILTAEIGTVWIGVKLLKIFGLPAKNILWYALNPLVIIELTGNLHFEAIMIFFLLFSFCFLLNEKIHKAAMVFALAVSTKLIPLIFLPILISYLGVKKGIVFVSLVGAIVLISFLPFINETMLLHMFSSIDLYFQNFEFNASIYFLVSAVYKAIVGYNLIAVVGPSLSVVALVFILFIAFKKKEKGPKQLMIGMLLTLSVYLLFATTVHPWYITTLILLSVFTKYRYVIYWSGLIVFTYISYSQFFIKEQVLFLLLEYTVVFGVLAYELKLIPVVKLFQSKNH